MVGFWRLWRKSGANRVIAGPGWYISMMRDTSPHALHIQLAALRRISPVERLRRAFELSEAMRELALVRLRTRYPGRSELELVELLTGHLLSPS